MSCREVDDTSIRGSIRTHVTRHSLSTWGTGGQGGVTGVALHARKYITSFETFSITFRRGEKRGSESSFSRSFVRLRSRRSYQYPRRQCNHNGCRVWIQAVVAVTRNIQSAASTATLGTRSNIRAASSVYHRQDHRSSGAEISS